MGPGWVGWGGGVKWAKFMATKFKMRSSLFIGGGVGAWHKGTQMNVSVHITKFRMGSSLYIFLRGWLSKLNWTHFVRGGGGGGGC